MPSGKGHTLTIKLSLNFVSVFTSPLLCLLAWLLRPLLKTTRSQKYSPKKGKYSPKKGIKSYVLLIYVHNFNLCTNMVSADLVYASRSA